MWTPIFMLFLGAYAGWEDLPRREGEVHRNRHQPHRPSSTDGLGVGRTHRGHEGYGVLSTIRRPSSAGSRAVCWTEGPVPPFGTGSPLLSFPGGEPLPSGRRRVGLVRAGGEALKVHLKSAFCGGTSMADGGLPARRARPRADLRDMEGNLNPEVSWSFSFPRGPTVPLPLSQLPQPVQRVHSFLPLSSRGGKGRPRGVRLKGPARGKKPGTYRAIWRPKEIAGGVYLCVLRAEDKVKVRKVVLAK